MSPKVSKPSLKAITPNEVKNIFGNVSLTNFYAVNFSGFGNSAGNLAELSAHMEGFGVNISDVLNNTGLMCTDASLPGSSLATAEVKDNFMGIPQEYAHTRLYTDIDFTFYVDRNYNNLLFFESWIDYISSASPADVYNTNYYRRMRYPDKYKCSTMTIKKFERDHNTVNTSLTYLFVNAFPKTVTAVPVSYGPADVLRVTVSFNYDRYIVNPQQTVERGVPTEFNNSRNAETKMISLDKVRSLSRTSDTNQPPGPRGPQGPSDSDGSKENKPLSLEQINAMTTALGGDPDAPVQTDTVTPTAERKTFGFDDRDGDGVKEFRLFGVPVFKYSD